MANGDNHQNGNGDTDLRAQLVEVLIDNVERDRFPSVTTMNLVEEMMTPEETARYAGILMDRLRADVYPSVDLMKRLRALVERTG
jgi:hypothetical protein